MENLFQAPARPPCIRSISAELVSATGAASQHQEHQQGACVKAATRLASIMSISRKLVSSTSPASQHQEHQQGACVKAAARPASIMSISSKLVSSTSPAGQHQEDQSKRTSTAGQHQEHQWKTCFRHQRGRLASGASAQSLFRPQARPASIRSISREFVSSAGAVGQHHEHQQEACFKHQQGRPASRASVGGACLKHQRGRPAS